MAKKRVMLTMDEDLLERIEKACASQGVTKSAYISMVVAKDLDDTTKLMELFKDELMRQVKEAGLELAVEE